MTAPGVYAGMPMDEYAAIRAVSHRQLQAILDECPAAIRKRKVSSQEQIARMESGSIAHALFLEQSERSVLVIDPTEHPNEKGGGYATGWTNKSIKAARDAARAAGRYPILLEDMIILRAMVAAARSFVESLRDSEPAIWKSFQPDEGLSEVTLVWEEDGLLCKARPDRLARDFSVITNYKTTAGSAEPSNWARSQMFGDGHYVGAAWYRRGVRALSGIEPAHVYLVQEVDEPYLCSVVGVDPKVFEFGENQAESALRQWQACVRSGNWPGYPARAVYPELPIWMAMRQEERETLSLEERMLLGSQA